MCFLLFCNFLINAYEQTKPLLCIYSKMVISATLAVCLLLKTNYLFGANTL